ncbi:MAG: M28 family peptidase [Nitrososphaeria archaeon]
MKIKTILLSLILASIILFSFAVPIIKATYKKEVDYGRMARLLPSNGEMFGWIKDIWSLGHRFYGGYPGYRLAGTPADHEAAKYVLEKFVEFGLENAHLEPVNGWDLWLPKEWRLSIKVAGEIQSIPCGFRPYTAFTDPDGITAEMVYVGTGTEAEFQAVNVENKIVLVDLIAPGLDADFLAKYSFFIYDPENTLPGRKATQNWPVQNLVSSYENAIKYKAAGYIGILNFLPDGRNLYYSPYTGVLTPLSGLYVSKDVGLYLKNLLKDGPVEANMILLGSVEPGLTYNVIGTLPGKTDEIILITSHHDGGATNDASGTSIVMGLAKYFAQLPQNSRKRTLIFLAAGGHFMGDIPTKAFIKSHPELISKTVAVLCIEMVCKEYTLVNGELVETGLNMPRGMFISGPLGGVDPKLLSFAINAITRYELDRTVVLSATGPIGCPGVGGWYVREGIPTIHYIAAPPHQFTPEDTPDKVAVEQLRPITAAYISIIQQIETLFND